MLLFSYLAAILLHECGHLTALALYRVKLQKVTASPFGLTISHTRLPSCRAEVTVALCGPLFGMIGYIALHNSASLPIVSVLSLYLSLFNLLPIETLDGHRALSSLLSSRLSPDKADAVSRLVSRATLFLLWVLGIYVWFILDESPSLFLMALTLFFQGIKSDSQAIRA